MNSNLPNVGERSDKKALVICLDTSNSMNNAAYGACKNHQDFILKKAQCLEDDDDSFFCEDLDPESQDTILNAMLAGIDSNLS